MKAELMKDNDYFYVENAGRYILTSKPKSKQEWFDIYVDLVATELKSKDRCFALRDLGKTDFQDVMILKGYYNGPRRMFCDANYETIRKPTWTESEMRDIYTQAKWQNSLELEVSEIKEQIL